MSHFYESVLIDTVDGFQFKSYANEHPADFIIAKPKYVPRGVLHGDGLSYRFLFSRCMVRFNLFAAKGKLAAAVAQLREKHPQYLYESAEHGTWFFGVPRNKIARVHDPRQGLQELLLMPKKDLDGYLALVVELVELLQQGGVASRDLGITHSTLLGNYTFGKSDIDIIIFGKENGWKILRFLEEAKHPQLRWKTEAEWKDYYQTHRTSESSHFTEEEYVKQMLRKRSEGMFGGSVFTLFIVEEPDEAWCPWGAERYERLGLVTVEGEVADASNSIVRPGYYGLRHSTIVEGQPQVPVSRVVSYSVPFMQQAREGERIRACGLLEKATPRDGGPAYYRIVVGYFDAYLGGRREQEYIKAVGL